MELKMFLRGELIDAVPINSVNASLIDYITYLKYQLVLKNEDLLSSTSEEPEFVIDRAPSQMNTFRSKLDEILESIYRNKKNEE